VTLGVARRGRSRNGPFSQIRSQMDLRSDLNRISRYRSGIESQIGATRRISDRNAPFSERAVLEGGPRTVAMVE